MSKGDLDEDVRLIGEKNTDFNSIYHNGQRPTNNMFHCFLVEFSFLITRIMGTVYCGDGFFPGYPG